MYLARKFRARRLMAWVREEQEAYRPFQTQEEKQAWQLKRFNELWDGIRQNVPYYRRLNDTHCLPPAFSSWAEFHQSVPILTRDPLQSQNDAFVDPTKSADIHVSTGGSTGQPVQLIFSKSQILSRNRDIWHGRSWSGIDPSDKLFLISGHSHLLGRGLRGWVNAKARVVKDSLIGYCRHSAYEMDDGSLRAAAQRMIRFKPRYVLGYSVALDRFARLAMECRDAIRELGVKVVIATAESFPSRDSRQVLSEVFGCPVIMEYGSIEFGAIAYERVEGGFTVFWKHHLVEALRDDTMPGAYKILITNLIPCAMPLIRYEIGDLVEMADHDPAATVVAFDSVIGRCNDYLQLPDGAVVHSEGLTHAIKEIPQVTGFQVTQAKGGEVTLRYTAREAVPPDSLAEIRRRLSIVNRQLADIDFERVESLEKTIAGKTRRIVRL